MDEHELEAREPSVATSHALCQQSKRRMDETLGEVNAPPCAGDDKSRKGGDSAKKSNGHTSWSKGPSPDGDLS